MLELCEYIFVGSGLGRNSNGISEPIKAVLKHDFAGVNITLIFIINIVNKLRFSLHYQKVAQILLSEILCRTYTLL